MFRQVIRPHLPQFGRYVVVGVANTALTYAVYVACVDAGLWYIGASTLGFCVGAVNGYVWNRRWTFRAGGGHASMLARYALVQVSALGTNLALLWLLVDVADLEKLASQAVVLPIVAAASFIANRQWTFAARPIAET